MSDRSMLGSLSRSTSFLYPGLQSTANFDPGWSSCSSIVRVIVRRIRRARFLILQVCRSPVTVFHHRQPDRGVQSRVPSVQYSPRQRIVNVVVLWYSISLLNIPLRSYLSLPLLIAPSHLSPFPLYLLWTTVVVWRCRYVSITPGAWKWCENGWSARRSWMWSFV
jgi:hypothetical protein